MDERTAMVTIGGVEYEMLLTTRATKQIAGRYGGLENLGEKLMKAENFEMALDEIVWLIILLCNQPIPRPQPEAPGGQKAGADRRGGGASHLPDGVDGLQGRHYGGNVPGYQAERGK